MINKLFKFLVIILVIEIFLGYLIYLKNSTLLTGHYLSSTIKTINKVVNIFENQKNNKPENKLNKSENKLNKSENNLNKDMESLRQSNQLSTAIVEEPVLKSNQKKCKNSLNKNQHIKFSSINAFRRQFDFQTDIEFLNSYDEKKDYLIVILGNSETFGNDQDFEARLHTQLQYKLREKFQSESIFVVNLAMPGGMISDHLRELLVFSLFYNPDLAIFYTGGNEIYLDEKYKEITNKISIKKEFFATFDFYQNELLLPNNISYCLNNKYLTKSNFNMDSPLLDVENHINSHFENINKTLTKKSTEFIFYIQPISLEPPVKNGVTYEIKNLDKIIELKIQDKNFTNLNTLEVREKLDFVDLFHTRDTNKVSQVILEDIVNKHQNKIFKKIFE